MFSGPIKSVGKTKIFAAPLNDTNRHLLVYQNQVAAVDGEHPIVMILPFFNVSGKKASIQFIDMKLLQEVSKENFFDCLDEQFARRIPKGAFRGKGRIADLGTDSPLEVFQSGSYQINLANNLTDLKRLRTDVFKGLPKNLSAILKKHYPTDCGFIVCQSTAVNLEAEPLAYIAPILNGKMLIPTRHAHGDDAEFAKDDWDHSIYLTCCSLEFFDPTEKAIQTFNLVDQPLLPDGNVGVAALFNLSMQDSLSSQLGDTLRNCQKDAIFKVNINGSYLNDDIVIPVVASSTKASTPTDTTTTSDAVKESAKPTSDGTVKKRKTPSYLRKEQPTRISPRLLPSGVRATSDQ